MALKFQVRSTQLNAYYATAFNDHGAAGGTNPALVATTSAGVFGNSLINVSSRPISYVGLDNMSQNGAFSILLRIVPNFSGNPGSAVQLFCSGPSDGNQSTGIRIKGNTNGTINVLMRNNNQSVILNDDTSGTVTYAAGEAFDLWVTWTGSSGANTCKVYYAANGNTASEIGSLAPTGSIVTRTFANTASIVIGSDPFGGGNNYLLNECVIWDGVESPTTYGSRAAFVSSTSAAFEGYNYTDPGVANVLSGTSYVFAGVTLTGTLTTANYTDPGAANVRNGTSYIYNNVTTTGTLNVPSSSSAASGAVNVSDIKETIRYVIHEANTTTGTPIDLSGSLSTRVKSVLKVNPEAIRLDANIFPYVTVFTTQKNIKNATIARDQATGKRRAEYNFTIVGCLFNDTTSDYRNDSADEDIEKLMENIEVILRHYASLNSTCNWQFPTGVTYHASRLGEGAHVRAGVMDLQVTVYY